MSDTEALKCPDWLPDLLEINGDPFRIFDDLYAVFRRDLVDSHPQFRGCPVWHDRRFVGGDDKEEGFWHLVTRQNYGADERQLDSRRAERLAWCAAILENASEPELTVWNYLGAKGKIQTYLWLEEWDYVVIVEANTRRNRRTGGDFTTYFLVTAFHVDRPKRADLAGRYARREPD